MGAFVVRWLFKADRKRLNGGRRHLRGECSDEARINPAGEECAPRYITYGAAVHRSTQPREDLVRCFLRTGPSSCHGWRSRRRPVAAEGSPTISPHLPPMRGRELAPGAED